MMDAALAPTLARVATLLADARGSWWVIGSAAVALHGAAATVAHDVDVLVDARDMPMLAAITGLHPRPGTADERFRSAQSLRLTDAPLAIELFADLDVREADGAWRRLRPATRVFVDRAGVSLPVPAADELIAILVRFGREKDLVRADLLRRAC